MVDLVDDCEMDSDDMPLADVSKACKRATNVIDTVLEDVNQDSDSDDFENINKSRAKKPKR